MRARQEGARAYLARVEAITNAPESMKAIIRSEVTSKIDLLEKTIKALEAKGWQGVLTRQIFAVGFLEKSTVPYKDDCRAALADYRKVSVVDIESFRIAEARFFDIRTLCLTNRVK